jgi:hypothetical protein
LNDSFILPDIPERAVEICLKSSKLAGLVYGLRPSSSVAVKLNNKAIVGPADFESQPSGVVVEVGRYLLRIAEEAESGEETELPVAKKEGDDLEKLGL